MVVSGRREEAEYVSSLVILERGTRGKVAQLDLSVELLFIVVFVDAYCRSSEHVPAAFPSLEKSADV